MFNFVMYFLQAGFGD